MKLILFATFLGLILTSHSKNQISIIKELQKKSEEYKENNQLDSVISLEKKIILLSQKNNYKLGEANAFGRIGLAYKLKGRFPIALKNLFHSLLLFEQLKDKKGIVYQLGNIGTIYSSLGDNLKAFSYYSRALKISKEINDKKSISSQYLNIAVCYTEWDSLELAEIYYIKALEIDKKTNNRLSAAMNLMNIGSLYARKQDQNKSLDYYFQSLEYYDFKNDFYEITNAYINISASYAEKFDKKSAINYLDSAFFYSNKFENLEFKTQLEWIAYQIFESFEDDKMAMLHYKKHIEYRDQLFNEENNRKNLEAEINYSYQRKKLKDQLKQTKKIGEINARNRLFKLSAYFSIFILSLIFFGIFFYIRFKNNKKQLLLKNEFSRQTIVNQEADKKRISQELHDSVGQNVLFIRNQLIQKNQLELIEATDATLNEIRSISRELYPTHLNQFGLKVALENLFKKAKESTKMLLSLDLDDFNSDLSKEIEINIYRIFQECLSNAIKHSNASSFRIVYEKRNHTHRFIIQDNGVGFDQKLINLSSIKSNGLLNIQERVSILSGKLSYQSEINKGVKIIIEI
jgi:signal transduction histidine kinase